MLDKPEKTYQLLAVLRAAVPFEVELTPSIIAHLRAQQVAVAVKPRQIVTEVSYAGDEGGIVCHMAPEEGRCAYRLDDSCASEAFFVVRRGCARLPEASSEEVEKAEQNLIRTPQSASPLIASTTARAV
jgi:hypothetical protein